MTKIVHHSNSDALFRELRRAARQQQAARETGVFIALAAFCVVGAVLLSWL